MHYHKCGYKLANHEKTGSVCQQIVAAADGLSCAECEGENKVEHFCSIHHPDPEHHVEPTPPPKK